MDNYNKNYAQAELGLWLFQNEKKPAKYCGGMTSWPSILKINNLGFRESTIKWLRTAIEEGI